MKRFAILAALLVLFCSAGLRPAHAAEADYKTDALGYVPYWLGVGPFPIDKSRHQKELIETPATPAKRNSPPSPARP